MKVMIGDYEVEIKARKTHFRDKFNKEDTNSFLNTMAIAFYEASNFDRMQGLQTLGECNAEMGRNVHDALEAIGYFKDI